MREAYEVGLVFVFPLNNHNPSPKSCSFAHWRRPFLFLLFSICQGGLDSACGGGVAEVQDGRGIDLGEG